VRLRSAERVNLDYTPTEVEALAALREMSGETGLAATVLAITGARVSEVVYLKRSELDLYGGWLRLNGKTGPRRFPLIAELRALLGDRGCSTDGRPAPTNPDARCFAGRCVCLRTPCETSSPTPAAALGFPGSHPMASAAWS